MIQAIIFNPTTGTASTISNNTIGGFDLTSSRSKTTVGENIFFGIYITGPGGGSQVTLSNNTIGSPTATNSIIIRSTAITVSGLVENPAAAIYMAQNPRPRIRSPGTISGVST